MVEVNVNPKSRTADFAVETGCPSCGGKLEVRVTPGHDAWAFCSACHWLSRHLLVSDGNAIRLFPSKQALA